MARVFTKGGWVGAVIPILVVGAIFGYFLMPEKVKNEIGQGVSSGPIADLSLQLDKLPSNKGDHYEIWLRNLEGGEQPIGYFKVMDGGSLVTLAGDPFTALSLLDVPRSGATLLVAVEKGDSPVSERSERIVLQGSFKETSVELKAVLPEIKGDQVALLANPTLTKSKGVAGLWFTKDANGVVSGLNLAKLPAGWKYGVFVVTDKSGKFFLGMFSDANKADEKSYFGGKKTSWSVPGEDFVANAPKGVKFPLELNDGKTQVIVSVEPEYREFLGNDVKPFLPILQMRIPYHQISGKTFGLETVKGETFPIGTGSVIGK
jgi:hypothetical protein